MHILWIVIIGFVAGIIARILSPGSNNPAGFILTTVLGDRRRVPRDLDRPGDRLVWPGSGRGPDRRGGRRAGGVVHLAPPGVTNKISDPGARRYL